MPDVTRYATDTEVDGWVNGALTDAAAQEKNPVVERGYDAVVQGVPQALHFNPASQENEGTPTERQVLDFESGFRSALSDAVANIPSDKDPVTIGILMSVNHKLDQRNETFRKLYDWAHWTGLAIDVELTQAQIRQFKEDQDKDKKIAAELLHCTRALTLLRKDDAYIFGEILRKRVDPGVLDNIAKFRPDLKEKVKELIKFREQRDELENEISKLSPNSLERAVAMQNKEALNHKIKIITNDPESLAGLMKRRDALHPTSIQRAAALQSGEWKKINEKIEQLQHRHDEALRLATAEKTKLETKLSEHRSTVTRNLLTPEKTNVTHYDSWKDGERRARYSSQIKGILGRFGGKKPIQGKTHFQRGTSSTCGEHTAINLAGHVGCTSVLDKPLAEIDKPNNDRAIRAAADGALEKEKRKAPPRSLENYIPPEPESAYMKIGRAVAFPFVYLVKSVIRLVDIVNAGTIAIKEGVTGIQTNKGMSTKEVGGEVRRQESPRSKALAGRGEAVVEAMKGKQLEKEEEISFGEVLKAGPPKKDKPKEKELSLSEALGSIAPEDLPQTRNRSSSIRKTPPLVVRKPKLPKKEDDEESLFFGSPYSSFSASPSTTPNEKENQSPSQPSDENGSQKNPKPSF